MEVKRISSKYTEGNVEITANEANDVRLMLSALHVYRNHLDTQRAVEHGLRNGVVHSLGKTTLDREVEQIDAMTTALRTPLPAEQATEAQSAEQS